MKGLAERQRDCWEGNAFAYLLGVLVISAKVDTLTRHVNKLLVVILSQVLNSNLIYRLCQVQHLHHHVTIPIST